MDFRKHVRIPQNASFFQNCSIILVYSVTFYTYENFDSEITICSDGIDIKDILLIQKTIYWIYIV